MTIRKDWNPDLLRSIGRLDFIAREVFDGVQQGMHRSIRRGFSSEFFDYKNYQPGDDAQKIDWRLYAKTRKFFVKRFEADTSLECMLLLDLTPSMAWRWEDRVSKLEYAVTLAASLGMLFVEQRDAVGLFTFGDGAGRYLAPRTSLKQLDALFGTLESPAVSGASKNMLETIHDLRMLQSHRGLITVISDFEVPEEEVRQSIQLLRAQRDEVIVFHLLDHAEVELPFSGITHFEDSETGVVMPVNLESLKKKHGQRLQEFRSFVGDQCRRHGITYVPIDTSYSYVHSIMDMGERRKELI